MQDESSLFALQKFMTAAVPFWQTLGLELKEVAPGRAVFEAAVLPGLMQNSVLHGGVLASIADSACAVAAIPMVFPARYATTINLQISYLKPVLEGRFRAEGRCLGPARTSCSVTRLCSTRNKRWSARRTHNSWRFPGTETQAEFSAFPVRDRRPIGSRYLRTMVGWTTGLSNQ